ncbi:MAG: hypothetical protein ACTSR9_18225 [Candidatus Thorarchaeota archaeon]
MASQILVTWGFFVVFKDWLTKVLEVSKLPTEAINSILVELSLNYRPAQKELREIRSKQGIASCVIDWLITKLSRYDDK